MDVGVTGPVKFSFDTGGIERHAMAFWCVMIPRRLFDELGLLDEIFDPGMGEDGDFCIKAELAGYSLVQVPENSSTQFGTPMISNFPIWHVGSGTFGWMDAGGIIERNKKILDERYGTKQLENNTVLDFQKLYYNKLIKDPTHRDNVTWNGITCLKCPTDMWAYQEIIFKIKPDVIVETGTYHGGSGLFLAQVCDMVNNGRVISVDIEKRDNLPTHPRLTYITGSSIDYSIVNQVKSFISKNDIVLVILDSEHTKNHVLQEMKLYGPLVSEGSYLIVEDTNVSTVLPEFGEGPAEAIAEFVVSDKTFEVDTISEKFLMTFNPGGYLRKMVNNDYYNGFNRELLNMIPPGSKNILEFGCANGLLGAEYKKLYPDAKWTGVDKEKTAVLAATDKLDKVFCCDIDSLTSDFFTEKYDAIVFGDLIEHLRYPEQFLDLLQEITIDNAAISCCIPNMAHFSVVEQLVSGELTYTDTGLLDKTHLRFTTIFSFIKMMLDSGWLPTMGATNYSTEKSEFLTKLIDSADSIEVSKEIAQRNLVTFQYYFSATKSPKAVLDIDQQLVVVVPVTNNKQYERNILCSPGLKEINATVIMIKDATSASDAFEKGKKFYGKKWVMICHQDVYFPKGSGKLILEAINNTTDEQIAIGFAGISSEGNYAGLLIDRVRPFDFAASDSALSIDEFAVILNTRRVKIDPNFGWHLWATDLCLQTFKDNGNDPSLVKIVRVPLFHNSYNQNEIPRGFVDSAERLKFKHGNDFAEIKTLVGTFSKDNKMEQRGVDSLEVAYDWCCLNVSDINEHIPTIRKYAEGCEHITEFGTRGCVSTYALMAAKPKKLLTYDIVVPETIWTADAIAKEHNIHFGFMERNTIKIPPIEETDLLFIDTLHTYAQLKKELEIHACRVKKYLIFHDTVSFGYIDELTDAPGGLCPAIEEFLVEHPEWERAETFTNNNGLTILKRVTPVVFKNPASFKYSIIIPTYNHCNDLLIPCVESVLKYTDMSQVELVISANGCTDNTAEYLEELRQKFDDIGFSNHLVTIWNDKPLGYAKANNVALEVCRGQRIVLLNNDVIMQQQVRNFWLDGMNDLFTKHPTCGVACVLQNHSPITNMDFALFFCVLIDRKMFELVGFLNEEYGIGAGEDTEFCAEVAKRGYTIHCVDEPVFKPEASFYVSEYPIYHLAEGTMHDPACVTGWTENLRRNELKLAKKYNPVWYDQHVGVEPYASLRKEPEMIINPSTTSTIYSEENMNNPKYSIVIPTYNHCDDLLKPCLESIIEFTDLSNVEVIVVANGCVDNTKEYVESLGPPFKLIWIPEASGYTKSTNVGIKAATGEYVVLLNNDTQILNSPKNAWLNILEEPFKKKSVGMTGPLELFDRYANMPVLIFFCVMIRRSVFDEVGLLDEAFHPGGGEDIDFTARIRIAGYEAICTEKTVYNGVTNVGNFPIWHKDNKTFSEIPEYTNWIIKRNGHMNCKKYNREIRLDLGSGGIEYPGFLSVDLNDRRANIKMDITKLDFEENSVTELQAIHVFEHLSPYDSIPTLKSWLKILKPGGKLSMEVPNLEVVCREFLKASQSDKYGWTNVIYGSVNTTDLPGDEITSPHLFGWWPESMIEHLHHSGFERISILPEQVPHIPCPEANFRVEAYKPIGITKEHLQTINPTVYHEIFERNEYQVFKHEIQGREVLDIGANKGFFTFLASSELDAHRVIAVEAQPEVFKDLQEIVKGLRGVTTINKAIWSVDDITVLIPNEDTLSKVGATGDPVQTVTLDTLSKDIRNGVLKMDVEGSEYHSLLLADNEVLRRFKFICVELHPIDNQDPEVIRNKLLSAKFKKVTEFIYTDNDGNRTGTYVEKWERE